MSHSSIRDSDHLARAPLACHSGRGVHRSPTRFRRDKNVSFEAILTRFDGSRADSLYNRLGVLWEADKVV